MKALVVGCQIKPYKFQDEGGKTKEGVTCRVMIVKGRPSTSEGSVGVEAAAYRCEEAVAKPIARALQDHRCPQVFDLDIDVAGNGERLKAVILGADHLGDWSDFDLDFVGGLRRPQPVPQRQPTNGNSVSAEKVPAAVRA